MTHDWHLFDAEAGYEVRTVDGGDVEVREVDKPHQVTRLTADEFDTWRAEGPNPRGLR